MRISESFEDYITYLVVEKGDLKSTIDTYLDDLKSFIEAVGDKEVRELKLDDISFFMRYLSSKNLKTSSIIRKLPPYEVFIYS